ncbi:hypothetical protein LguiB_028312 [Lonicera macranthoides]
MMAIFSFSVSFPSLDCMVLNPSLIDKTLANNLDLPSSGVDRFALWNPGTREFKPLPSHPITDEFETDQLYDEAPVRKLDGSILSKSNVWLNSSLRNSNTYWNGFYYWTASIYRVQQLKIYALDMVNEVFLEIHGPPVPFTSLTMCNGRIATWRIINLSMETWVMESVGFWTKQFTIGPSTNFRNILGYWMNGGIFFATNTRDSRLILCNPNQELRELGPQGDGHVYIHKESLVSLQGGKSNKKENVSTDLVAPIRVFLNLNPRISPKPNFALHIAIVAGAKSSNSNITSSSSTISSINEHSVEIELGIKSDEMVEEEEAILLLDDFAPATVAMCKAKAGFGLM